jgi:iron complex outermembrane receptor protein
MNHKMNFFQSIKKITGLFLLFSVLNITVGYAQKQIDRMTKEDVLAMSYDELAELSLEDLMKLADIVGVSIDDLFNMVLNRDISIASKSSESFFDTPLSTTVITSEDIARMGVLSIPEAMRLIPGVIVREKTNGNYDIHIRGNDNIPYGQTSIFSENTLTLVMVDGRAVYNYATGGTFWESLPVGVNDIDRIEVVRGPASALYGPNAVTGVINIITKKVESKKPSVEASIQSGNRFQSLPVSLAVSGTQNLGFSFGINDKLKFRIAGSYNYRDRSQEDVYLWKDENQKHAIENSGYYPVSDVTLVKMKSEEMYDDPSMALDAYAFNGYMFYNPNPDIHVDLSAGMQRSIAISSNTDMGFVMHTTRQVETQYADLKASLYGFNLQTNYMWGYENLSMGSPGYEFDVSTFNLNLDYNFKLLENKLNIHPGFSYTASKVSDDEYMEVFLRAGETLSSFAPSIRADYKPIEQLRFVGAFRYEKNANPDKAYPTWQFVANYRVNDNSSFRAVYSRANRSPFMLDVQAKTELVMKDSLTMNNVALVYPSDVLMFSDDANDRRNRYTAKLEGNKNLKLAVMDMVELGYRQKVGKHVLLNFEFFFSQLRDMSSMQANSVRITNVRPYPSTPPMEPIPQYAFHYIYEQHNTYENIAEIIRQYGATAEIGVVVNSAWNFRFFGTLQQTNIKNHSGYTGRRTGHMKEEAEKNPATDWTTDDVSYSWEQVTDSLVNSKGKATPNFFGGFEINWLPADKWTVTSTGYGFSKQTYIHQYGPFDIAAKMLVNLRVAYGFAKNSSVFMTVNNIFNATSPEFGFMDKTGAQWHWGVRVKF